MSPILTSGAALVVGGSFGVDHLAGDGNSTNTILAIVAAVSALAAAVTNFQARRQRVAVSEVLSLRRLVETLRVDVLSLSTYSFSLRSILARNGIQTPEPPRLRSEDPDPVPPSED